MRGGGDSGRMPVETEHTAQCLEPIGVGRCRSIYPAPNSSVITSVISRASLTIRWKTRGRFSVVKGQTGTASLANAEVRHFNPSRLNRRLRCNFCRSRRPGVQYTRSRLWKGKRPLKSRAALTARMPGSSLFRWPGSLDELVQISSGRMGKYIHRWAYSAKYFTTFNSPCLPRQV
jgi:hypothetical protein